MNDPTIIGWVAYILFLTVSTAIFALFSLGLNLQWGLTGLINFGLVAFMTLGAYTTVLLSMYGVPLIVATLAGALVAALLGWLIGLSTLRLREDYLAIVTIGVSELIRLVVNNQDLPTPNTPTPGAFGLQGYPLPLTDFNPDTVMKWIMVGLLTLVVVACYWKLWKWAIGSQKSKVKSQKSFVTRYLPLVFRAIVGIVATLLIFVPYAAGAIGLYNFTNYEKSGLMLISVLVLAFVVWRLEVLARSPWGRVLKAIREDEEVARALGKNVFWYKLQALMLGGAIAGISGALYAWQQTSIYPNDFQPQTTFDAWIMVILGGAGNNFGTILGAVVFFAYDSATRFILPKIVPLDDVRLSAFRIMVIGLLLMILMIWRPQGILGKKEELTLGK
ncbi:branched-chain amino acid ABC transporter permease [Chroococcidiopsis cubana CCALA 043]|nr:branched-chain amino acid ABC transporter permease [Cyanosarcina cf. burmensis CCALA 770]PSB66001.1 branched-chain amino acid ABC transporter permease [Chroococcidiopsis cubana CCALA 043]PSM48373.1 branched-chain amino acid ABC transporter permease [Chroococcidiopsis sp. CCALA 051]